MLHKRPAQWQYQKSVASLSLGFNGTVTVSPPVIFSMIVELVALVIVELSLLLLLLNLLQSQELVKKLPQLRM
jgi:hypothetical protein